MIPQHAGTRVAHDEANLLTFFGFVAMYQTLLAIALVLAIGTSVKAMNGVQIKREAFITNAPPPSPVLVTTIDLDHLPDHYLFTNDIYLFPTLAQSCQLLLEMSFKNSSRVFA